MAIFDIDVNKKNNLFKYGNGYAGATKSYVYVKEYAEENVNTSIATEYDKSFWENPISYFFLKKHLSNKEIRCLALIITQTGVYPNQEPLSNHDFHKFPHTTRSVFRPNPTAYDKTTDSLISCDRLQQNMSYLHPN